MKDHIFRNVQAILFDFEGTLVDFQWKLAEAVEEVLQMLEDMGFTRDLIQNRKYSTLLPEVLQIVSGSGLRPEKLREEIFAIYDKYDEDALMRWTPRPGVQDFLSVVHNRKIHTGLISNVGIKTLSKALQKFSLEGFFDVVLSRNDVTNLKPSPDGLNLALKKLNAIRDCSIFVGDSLDDIHSAKNAGLRVVIISDGENLRDDILAAKPDYMVRGYDELSQYMDPSPVE